MTAMSRMSPVCLRPTAPLRLTAPKRVALGYLYYIQKELGLRNIGIAEDEYPTDDGLPMIPYYRGLKTDRGGGDVLLGGH